MITRAKRFFALLLPAVLIMNFLLSNVIAMAAGVVTDSVLKNVIQLKFGLPSSADITVSDMERITTLAYSGYAASVNGKISNLQGMQYATNMTLLDVTDCNVSSLAPLANLTALKTLVLINNPLDLRVGSPDYAIIIALKARGCNVIYNTPKPSPYLTGIKTSKGSISPPFKAGVYSYTVTLPDTYAGRYTVITPVKADPAAKMKINGHSVRSVKVNVGVGLAKNVKITVTSRDRSSTKTYMVKVYRPSSDCKLSAIRKTTGSLYPVFSPGKTSYVLSLSSSKSAVTITPVKSSKYARVLINGVAANSLKVTVARGETKLVKITVIAQNGATREYSVSVRRGQ